MYNHAPQNYICPLCQLVAGNNDQLTKQSDIVYRNNLITAFIAAKWWVHNPGHIIVIPNQHYENIYDISEDLFCKVYAFTKKAAIVLKEVYNCDGTSTQQHNEPAGNQDVWHFHVHVFPRYTNDKLYQLHGNKRWTEPKEREPYAKKLRDYFEKHI